MVQALWETVSKTSFCILWWSLRNSALLHRWIPDHDRKFHRGNPHTWVFHTTRGICPVLRMYILRKNYTPVLGSFALFWVCENTRILVIFQDRPMFSHTNGKLSPRSLYCIWLDIRPSSKITKIRTTPALVLHPKQVRTPLNKVFRFLLFIPKHSLYQYFHFKPLAF